MRATILDRQAYPPAEGAPDEIVVGATEHVREEDLLGAIQRGGGVDVDLWRTAALDLGRRQTKALTLAARVGLTPEELPLAVAEMPGAQVVTDLRLIQDGSERGADDGPTLQVPSPSTGLFVFCRPDEPFTPAESARANRLADGRGPADHPVGLAGSRPRAVRAEPPDRTMGSGPVLCCHRQDTGRWLLPGLDRRRGVTRLGDTAGGRPGPCGRR